MMEQLKNESNDGLECFNFKLFLDDINSSSQKKKSVFLSPQQETVKKPKIADSQFNISRNLGSDFKRAYNGINDFDNFDLYSGSKNKNPKNRTPETNYTTQSSKGVYMTDSSTNKKMFNIWGDFHLSRADDEEKRAKEEQKKNLMEELQGKLLGNSAVVQETKSEFSLFKECSRSYVGGNINDFSEMISPKLGEKQNSTHIESPKPNLFNDIFSVSSSENSTSKVSKKSKKGKSRGALAKFSESFEPFPIFDKKPIKKNSFSACKITDLTSNYRKGSYNERDYRRGRNYINFGNFDFGGKVLPIPPTTQQKVNLNECVNGDVDFLIENLKSLVEKAIGERRLEEFPLIGKNH